MSEIVIDVAGLTKRYGEKTVVDGLSMQVRRGEIYGFLGPNGSGKTTSIRMMCGLLTPDGGTGHTLGYDVVSETAAIKREVGYMTQRFGLYEDLSIRENLDFVARIYGMKQRRERVSQALDRLGLSARQQQLAGSLSGGWKQRLALAACMLHQPRLLLLDEPTAGVDPHQRQRLWDLLYDFCQEGMTLFVTTHYLDEAERCHNVGFMLGGRMVAHDSPARLRDKLKGHMLGVQTTKPMEAMRALKALPEIQHVTLYGYELRLFYVQPVHVNEQEQKLRAVCERAGAPLTQVHVLQPTLEDLFMLYTIEAQIKP